MRIIVGRLIVGRSFGTLRADCFFQTDMPADSNAVFLTAEGLKQLEEELKNLKTEKRREVAARLEEAISFGDLSENSEYDEAKNEQARVEGRILEVEKMLKNVQLIDEKKAHAGKTVRIGSTVTIKSEGEKDSETFTIVGSTEANPLEGRISNESPVGSALLGKKKGDSAQVAAPSGDFVVTITQLT